MQPGAFQKIKFVMYRRLTEIILAALLTLAIAIFAHGLTAQADLAARLRDCEREVARNVVRVNGIKEALETGDRNIREALETGDRNLSAQIKSVLERVDQRCDRLENMLDHALKRENTGGK